MSQKVTRKSQPATADDKEKRQTDSPVKDIKKKMAATADKEKPTEKVDKPDKSAEKTDKSVEKSDKAEKKTDKAEPKKVDNKVEKNEKKNDSKAEKKAEKPAEKKVEKPAEKKAEKPVEKKTEKPVEKKPEPEKKEEDKIEKNGKDKPEKLKSKQNGVEVNGSVPAGSSGGESDSDSLMIDDAAFPELSYQEDDDDDDERPRAATRRDQVKATKTPETPRPASDKDIDDPKDAKVLKLSEVPPASDRKLRSSDSPKPDAKKEATKTQEEEKEKEKETEKSGRGKDVDVVIEIEDGESRVKTRARVSPYTRPSKHDQTVTSVMANYTGNNTTMEMDISESSSMLEEGEDSFLRSVRNIRGRASYRLHPQSLQQILANRSRHSLNTSVSSISESGRPTGAVVGRKRKPEDDIERCSTSGLSGVSGVSGLSGASVAPPPGKRSRLLDRLAGTFRRSYTRSDAEIVGINSDLPLSAPLCAPRRDPESLKAELPPSAAPAPRPALLTNTPQDKRCVLM